MHGGFGDAPKFPQPMALEFGLRECLRNGNVDLLNAVTTTLQRIRPGLDDKILTAWNGLAPAAFAEAGRVLGHEDYLLAAVQNAEFIYRELRLETAVCCAAGKPATVPGIQPTWKAMPVWRMVKCCQCDAG